VCSRLARALIVRSAREVTRPRRPPMRSSHMLLEIAGNMLHMRQPPFELPPEPPVDPPPGGADAALST
jgi:hypothetical protein